MPTNSLERQKRELLNRLAIERMQALESAETVRRSAEAGVAAVRGSGRFLRYMSLAATGLVAAGACTFAARSMRPRRKALPAPAKSGFLRTLLLQSATIVFFPCLRELLSRCLSATAQPTQRKAPPLIDLSRYNPMNIFFRWLGLDR